MLTASALIASAEATHRRLGGPGRWLLALPAYHVAGLQVLVRSVIADTTPVAVPAGFDGAELASAVASLGSGRRYASLVAAQLDKALQDPAAAAALASLNAVLIGGGPMPEGVAERALAAGVSVLRTYGMRATVIRWNRIRSRSLAGFAPTTLAPLMIQACCECWAGSTMRSAPAG